MPKPPAPVPPITPSQSHRVLGFASRPESELSTIARTIRIAAGTKTSRRKPSLPPLPWDKDLTNDQ